MIAFNKVLHRRLLWKVEYIGELKRTLRNQMEDYLKGRETRTVVKDEILVWREVKRKIPQGSLLAPIIFAVYVN